MAWQKDNGPDGLPVWRGKDGIYNMSQWKGGGGLAAMFAVVVLGFCLMTVSQVLGFLVVLSSVPFAAYMKRKGVSPDFIGDEWSLSASRDALAFKGGESWSVPLDAVARVETALTSQYSPSRRQALGAARSELVSVSEHEWQTFLFLADGTRRVIYHANAARDDCAALAASVRGWLESARAAAPVAAAPSQGRAAVADGFDL